MAWTTILTGEGYVNVLKDLFEFSEEKIRAHWWKDLGWKSQVNVFLNIGKMGYTLRLTFKECLCNSLFIVMCV